MKEEFGKEFYSGYIVFGKNGFREYYSKESEIQETLLIIIWGRVMINMHTGKRS